MHTRTQQLDRTDRPAGRDDLGFSFVQLIVTMIISGILLGGIGFTVFSFINTARDTVLSANIATAANAVQTTLALNPTLRTPADATTGEPSANFISALTANAPFSWTGGDWTLANTDEPTLIRIQMILIADDGATATTKIADVEQAADAVAPKVRWVIGDGDAVRIQSRNTDGSWACALIVLRPDWDAARAAGSPGDDAIATAEANLRGIWYDGGSSYDNNAALSEQHCSPVANTTANTTAGSGGSPGGNSGLSGDADTLFGNTAAGDAATAIRDVLPLNSSSWNVGGATGANPAIPARTFDRAVPSFD